MIKTCGNEKYIRGESSSSPLRVVPGDHIRRVVGGWINKEL